MRNSSAKSSSDLRFPRDMQGSLPITVYLDSKQTAGVYLDMKKFIHALLDLPLWSPTTRCKRKTTPGPWHGSQKARLARGRDYDSLGIGRRNNKAENPWVMIVETTSSSTFYILHTSVVHWFVLASSILARLLSQS